MTVKPLLSIVVPTKDRYKYLKHLITLIDSFNSKEIELVLQDNTVDNKEILEFLAQKEYSYIKYDHREKQLPIYYNSDLAILNSSGEYICFIGDDDGVTNHIVDCVKWMKKNEIEVVVPETINYKWPDYIDGITGRISGTLSFKPFSNSYQYVNPKTSLEDIMNKGFINRGELPLLYHGIVKRNVLDKIYKIGKTYFPGPSPDIANGVALSLLATKYGRLNFPIVISGASVVHGGGIRKLNNKFTEIKNIPALPKNAEENWEKNIPKVWAGETVWPESAIKALRYMEREDLIKKVNFEYMLATFITFHFSIRSLAIKLSKNKIRLWNYTIIQITSRYYKGAIRLILRKFFNREANKIIIRNINNIEQAAQYLSDLRPKFLINNDN